MKYLLIFFLIISPQIFGQAGALDTSFGNNGILINQIVPGEPSSAAALEILDDGKFVVLSDFGSAGSAGIAVSKFNQNGTIDSSFGNNGEVIIQFISGFQFGTSLKIQSDGKIIVSGGVRINSQYEIAFARLNIDGSFDTTFGNNGKIVIPLSNIDEVIRDFVVNSANEIYGAGYTDENFEYDILLVKLTPDGSLDTSFGINGVVTSDISGNKDQIYGIQYYNDKLLVAGVAEFTQFSDFFLAKYSSTGALETSFGTGGITTTSIGDFDATGFDLKVRTDGKILVAGKSETSQNSDFASAQFGPDGNLDPTYGDGGKVISDFGGTFDSVWKAIIQPDDKVILLGYAGNQSAWDFGLARYNSNGQLDSTFGNGGLVKTNTGSTADFLYDGKLQIDNKILVVGSVWNGSYGDMAIARYTSGLPLGINENHLVRNIQVYPNPAVDQITISYNIESPDFTRIDIFDITGRKIRTLLDNEFRDSGINNEIFDLKDLSAGTYLVQISSGTQFSAIKVILL